ncbi:MAG: endonuclease/exonuclease/phosphatase family protein [Actinomycetota bacterium]
MLDELTVATYNLHHCEGLDGIVDVGRVARVLTGTGAAVVGLQEIDDGLSRSGRTNQPTELAEALGLEITFYPTLERGGGRYGLGLAARGGVEARFERLPRRGDEEPRGALVARTGDVWVVVTHLSRDRFSRASQTRALASLAKDLDGPVVIMGDLNQTTTSLGPLTEVGLVGDGLRHQTMPLQNVSWWRRWLGLAKGRHIDHVLAGGGARVVRSWTVASDASDHLPLVAQIGLR